MAYAILHQPRPVIKLDHYNSHDSYPHFIFNFNEAILYGRSLLNKFDLVLAAIVAKRPNMLPIRQATRALTEFSVREKAKLHALLLGETGRPQYELEPDSELVLRCMRGGLKATDIAKYLKVSPSTITKIRTREIKSFKPRLHDQLVDLHRFVTII